MPDIRDIEPFAHPVPLTVGSKIRFFKECPFYRVASLIDTGPGSPAIELVIDNSEVRTVEGNHALKIDGHWIYPSRITLEGNKPFSIGQSPASDICMPSTWWVALHQGTIFFMPSVGGFTYEQLGNNPATIEYPGSEPAHGAGIGDTRRTTPVISEVPLIPSETGEDREEVHKLGGVECHYALKGNVNYMHPEQQDRAAAYVLSGGNGFQEDIKQIFSGMERKHRQLRAETEGFIGDCCTTVAMLDPKSGKLAIGSKGDAPVYLILRNKNDPGRTIIQRISTEYVNASYTVGNRNIHGPHMIGTDLPVMWTRANSWRMPLTSISGEQGSPTNAPGFELMDIRTLAHDILQARGVEASEISLDNYEASLLLSSDGILNGANNEEERLRTIARIASEDSRDNKAQAILNHACSDGSYDNLSAILLKDIKLGEGRSIAACICDGNHNGDMQRVHEGSQASEAMIHVFEGRRRYLALSDTGRLVSQVGSSPGSGSPPR